MTFHLSPEFMNAVEATAKYHKLQEVFIEKDYWITYALFTFFQKLGKLLIQNDL